MSSLRQQTKDDRVYNFLELLINTLENGTPITEGLVIELVNRMSLEFLYADTPDYILGRYIYRWLEGREHEDKNVIYPRLLYQLELLTELINSRDRYYGVSTKLPVSFVPDLGE